MINDLRDERDATDRTALDSADPYPPDWKVLVKVPSRQEAALISGLLESVGIEAQLESKLFTQEPVALGLLGMMTVWVPADRIEAALEVLEEQSREAGELLPAEAPESDLEEMEREELGPDQAGPGEPSS